MNTKINIKQKKSKSPVIILTTFIIIIGLTTVGITKCNSHYNTPSLIGEWVSEETGKTIEFTEDGYLAVDELKTGSYKIESPGLIIYEVEGHTFEMDYEINERILVWGLSGEEEKFERKGI